MAEQFDLIDRYLNRAGVQEDTDFLLSQLKAVSDAFDKLQARKVDIGAATSTRQTIQAIKEAGEATAQAKKKTDELSLSLQEFKRINDQTAVSRAKNNALTSDSAKVLTQEKESLRQRNAELKNQVREESAAKGSIEQRRAALIRLTREYDRLSKAERESERGVRLGNVIGGLSQQLKELEAATGRFQRNVGNYRSGFNGLSNSVAQITREMPAFTNSVQTGFLALSNNLPIFFDEVARARAEIKALRAEGQAVPGIFRRIASSLLSWQSALSIGVTLLVVYSKEIGNFFTSLFKGKEALDAVKIAQDNVSKALASTAYTDAIKNVNELTNNIELAKEGLIDKEAVVKQYNDSIGKTTGYVEDLDEAEQALVRNGDAYIQVTLQKAVANLALEEAAKKAFEAEQKRRKDAEEFLTTGDELATAISGASSTDFGSAAQNKETGEKAIEEQSKKRKEAAIKASEDEQKVYEDIAKEAQRKAAELAKKFGFDLFGGEGGGASETRIKALTKKFFDDELKDAADQQQKLSEIEDLGLAGRITARRNALAIEKQIIEGNRDAELQNEINKLNAVKNQKNVSANELKNATNEFNQAVFEINQRADFQLQKLTRDSENDILSIRQQSIGKEKELDRQYHEETLAGIEDFYQKKIDAAKAQEAQDIADIARRKDADIEALNEQYQAQLAAAGTNQKKIEKATRDYNDRRAEIEFQYAAEVLRTEIKLAEQIIALHRAQGKNVSNEEKALAELRMNLSDLETKHIISNNQQQQKSHEDKLAGILSALEKVRAYSATVFDIIGGAIDASIIAEKNKLQEQSDAIDKRKQQEIEAIEATALSEQEKADKISVINAKAQAQKDAIAIKQRQADQQRAEFEKARGIFEIIINTALAVVKALPDIPLATIAGAIGAAQLAVAVATPVPKYATGTDFHPGGDAIVGDGGKKEYVILPDGTAFTTSDQPTRMRLPRGTQVLPDADKVSDQLLLMAMRQLPNSPVTESSYGQHMTEAITQELRGLKSTIKNKRETHIHGSHGAVVMLHRWAQNELDYIEDNIRFR